MCYRENCRGCQCMRKKRCKCVCDCDLYDRYKKYCYGVVFCKDVDYLNFFNDFDNVSDLSPKKDNK
jgi:hypothetical protein